MKVKHTWLVKTKNGFTPLYLTESGVYYLSVVTPTGSCWTDIITLITEDEALDYIIETNNLMDI